MAEQLKPVLDVEPVLALRMWIRHEKTLYSWSASIVWPAHQVMKSRCARMDSPPHESNQLDLPCSGQCGLYGVAHEVVQGISYTEPGHFLFECGPRGPLDDIEHAPSVPTRYGSVWAGVVALWGRVIRGASGVYRAEYGYPAAIFAGPSDKDVAEAYGIPVLPVPKSAKELRDLCRLVRDTLLPTT